MVGYSALAERNEALALELLAEQQTRLRPLFPLRVEPMLNPLRADPRFTELL